MTTRLLLVIGLTITMIGGGRALAQPADQLKKAQASFDQAQTDYLQGKYDEAAQEFQDAYAARPFPQFLYNVGASFHMKGKKTSDVASYQKAVEFYKKYLAEEPNATDKPKVEKAIGVLEAEIKRLTEAPKPPGDGSGSGSGSAAPAQAPSQEVQQLGDVKVRGLVVIVTEPQNATVYLDDKKKGPFATTPWSGSIDGEHKLIIEKRGYNVVESTISADPTKLVQVIVPMSQANYLAWVDITANVPGAEIFIDDKTVGSVGHTPLSQNIKPGKHTFWISAEGYDEFSEQVDIAAGETHAVKATLRGSPVGRLEINGTGIEDARIAMDGKVLCEHGPCIHKVPEGEHEITITRPDYKPITKHVTIQPKTDTVVKVALSPSPGRGDAITAYIVAAIFGGGGIYAGLQANSLRDQLNKAITAGTPPVDSNDPRFLKGKIYAISADAAFGIAGITFLTALYYTFRDKGPPSSATIDVHSIALQPELGEHFAGIGMGGRW